MNSYGEQPVESRLALLGEIVKRFEALPPGDSMIPHADAFFGRNRGRYDQGPSTFERLRSFDERFAGVEMGEDVLLGLGASCALLIPIFDYYPRNDPKRVDLIVNPRLADLGFQRIMDPYACFQAIETFLGNQLAPPDLAPQRVGSDEILARQKGFDEASFRTAAPGGKKENRARNRARKKGP